MTIIPDAFVGVGILAFIYVSILALIMYIENGE